MADGKASDDLNGRTFPGSLLLWTEEHQVFCKMVSTKRRSEEPFFLARWLAARRSIMFARGSQSTPEPYP
jgi:hypothetical protein